MNNPIKHSGFSFIEVLVALVVTSIGLLGLASLQLRAMKIESSSLGRSQATLVVESLANNIYLSEGDPLSYVTSENGIKCESFNEPDKICADTDPDSTAEECSLSQNAIYAIWDNLCRGQSETDVISSGSRDLIDPTLRISCNNGFDLTACENAPPSLQISLSWKNLLRKPKSDPSSTEPVASINAETISYSLEINP